MHTCFLQSTQTETIRCTHIHIQTDKQTDRLSGRQTDKNRETEMRRHNVGILTDRHRKAQERAGTPDFGQQNQMKREKEENIIIIFTKTNKKRNAKKHQDETPIPILIKECTS